MYSQWYETSRKNAKKVKVKKNWGGGGRNFDQNRKSAHMKESEMLKNKTEVKMGQKKALGEYFVLFSWKWESCSKLCELPKKFFWGGGSRQPDRQTNIAEWARPERNGQRASAVVDLCNLERITGIARRTSDQVKATNAQTDLHMLETSWWKRQIMGPAVELRRASVFVERLGFLGAFYIVLVRISCWRVCILFLTLSCRF